MKLLLLDTQLVVWGGYEPARLSRTAQELIEDTANELSFSAISIWEIAIKQALGRSGFKADARFVRDSLLANGYHEVPLTSEHAVAIRRLPRIHGDPFDRILIAQAMCEGLTLMTADSVVASYPGPILKV